MGNFFNTILGLGNGQALFATLSKKTRAKPGAALYTPLLLFHSLINSVSASLPPLPLRRRQAQTVRDNANGRKIEYVAQV